jgi:general secretion pathway protein H
VHGSGFTFIELLIVLVVLGVMLGLVGIVYTRSPLDEVREQAEALTQRLQVAQGEAATQGRIYGVEFSVEGYHFLVLDDQGALVTLDRDELLRPQKLARDIEVAAVSIEGAVAGARARILFVPSGAATNFHILLRKQEAKWYVKGTADGQIQATPTLEPLAHFRNARLHAA